MDILTVIQAVFRRWYVTFPVLLAAGGVAFVVNDTIPPAYQARGEILLASPELDPSALPRTVTDLRRLAEELATPDVQTPLIVGSTVIEVDADPNALSLALASGSPADAQATANNVVAWLEQEVEARQAAAGIEPVERLQVRSTLTPVATEDLGEQPLDITEGAATGDNALLATVTLNDPVAGATNPFGASNASARVLTVAVQSDQGRERVTERTGPDLQFELRQDPRDPAPILVITTRSSDPDTALDGFGHIAEVVALELAEREERAEVPPSRRTGIEALAAPQQVTDVSPPLDRSVATILGLGLLAAVVLAILAESIAQRRHHRRTRRRRHDPQPSDPAADAFDLPSPPQDGPPPYEVTTK